MAKLEAFSEREVALRHSIVSKFEDAGFFQAVDELLLSLEVVDLETHVVGLTKIELNYLTGRRAVLRNARGKLLYLVLLFHRRTYIYFVLLSGSKSSC